MTVYCSSIQKQHTSLFHLYSDGREMGENRYSSTLRGEDAFMAGTSIVPFPLPLWGQFPRMPCWSHICFSFPYIVLECFPGLVSCMFSLFGRLLLVAAFGKLLFSRINTITANCPTDQSPILWCLTVLCQSPNSLAPFTLTCVCGLVGRCICVCVMPYVLKDSL